MAIVTVPGFGDGTILPLLAPNWSHFIQQLAALNGTTDPPLAPMWTDKRGTGRPPPAPNWMDQAVLDWPPPASNWLSNNCHRSHLNKQHGGGACSCRA